MERRSSYWTNYREGKQLTAGEANGGRPREQQRWGELRVFNSGYDNTIYTTASHREDSYVDKQGDLKTSMQGLGFLMVRAGRELIEKRNIWEKESTGLITV